MASLFPKIDSRLPGQTLVEILVAMALAALFMPVLAVSLVSSRNGKAQQQQRLVATALLQEEGEAIRSIRNKGWVSFAVNGTFYPAISGFSWILNPGSESTNGFTRSLVISDVNRDSSGSIVATGGQPDPSTKKVHLTVSWTSPQPYEVTSDLLFTRYMDNLTYTQTTAADFNTGTKSNVTVTNTAGGEVTLGAGGQSNWCDPNLSIAALDLPKNGVANALTAIEGRAFAGTGNNASGVSFASISISNTNPPVANVSGTFDGFKTNSIFGESGYAYLATDNNQKEIEIINLSSSPYSEAGYFNSPGNGKADSIFVSGSVGFMTSGNSLYSFNLSSKSGSRPQLGVVSLAGTGLKVVVNNNYAYVVTGNASTQLQIINVADPAHMTVVGQTRVQGQSGRDVYVNTTGTRAYLVTAADPVLSEFFIIDVSSKTGDRPTIGSYFSQGMSPKGVIVVPGNKAILVGTGGEEYQVLNIFNESLPIRCGGINIDSGINGIAAVLESDGDAYSYIITGDTTSEFKIIAGGPGGNYSNLGVFESSTFDPGFQTAFNHFDATSTVLSQTEIKYQLAVADAVSGSCSLANFVFVGPDGTPATYFTTGGAVPTNDDGLGFENPGRCFRYKVFLSSQEPVYAPVFSDITVNYSP
jgi:type II secretory pathway pseudopilin PulG